MMRETFDTVHLLLCEFRRGVKTAISGAPPQKKKKSCEITIVQADERTLSAQDSVICFFPPNSLLPITGILQNRLIQNIGLTLCSQSTGPAVESGRCREAVFMDSKEERTGVKLHSNAAYAE